MKSVLLIQTAFIGDLILSTVLIENLHLNYPGARIDFLVRKGNEDVLQSHPYIRNVLTWDKKKGKYYNLLSLLKKVRKEQYDLVINVQRYAATGLLCGLSGAKHRIGYDKNPLSFLFTRKTPHLTGQTDRFIHETTRCNQLLDGIVPCSTERPKLYPSPYDYKRIAAFTRIPYLVIAPGSIWFTKQTPIKKWIAILDKIPPFIQIYIIGSSKEIQLAQAILAGLPEHTNIHSLAGQLTLLQSAALMESALFNLVNDSAPMHIASAMNAPVIALYCSTSPGFGFTPLSSESYIIQAEEALPCRPCGRHGKSACPEKHFNCGQYLDENKILQIINKKIASPYSIPVEEDNIFSTPIY
jgi:heptosyltransferase-2